MNKHLVFVYGSLRSGGAGAMSTRYPESQFIAEARVNGSLYDLGPYPGLQLDEAGSPVVGEVYEVGDALLSELDDFEASSNYLRKPVEVWLGSERRSGWTYEPNPEFYALEERITSGDWIEYAGKKTARPAGPLPESES